MELIRYHTGSARVLANDRAKFGYEDFNSNEIFLYLDLHAHATKAGCFIYGDYFEDLEVQASAMLFPKLISMNTLNLSN